MEFSYLQVLIDYFLCAISLKSYKCCKKWRGILWLTLLKNVIYNHIAYWYHATENIANQMEFRNSMYIWWYCTHSSYCVLWSYSCQNRACSSAVWVMSEPNSSLNINVQVMTKNKWLVGYSMVYHSALHNWCIFEWYMYMFCIYNQIYKLFLNLRKSD